MNQGSHASPDATIIIEAGDYVELVRGKLSHRVALRSGRLKITGDINLAMKMQPLFLMGGPGTYGPGKGRPEKYVTASGSSAGVSERRYSARVATFSEVRLVAATRSAVSLQRRIRAMV